MSSPDRRLHAQQRRVAITAIRKRDRHVQLTLIGSVRHLGDGDVELLFRVDVAAVKAEAGNAERGDG